MRRISIILAFVLSACAAQTAPQLTRDEALESTTREYAGKSEAEILDAARRVLALADSAEFTFGYPNEDVMTAARPWFVYMVFGRSDGVDNWRVQVEETGRARVSVTGKPEQSGSSRGYPAAAGPSRATPSMTFSGLGSKYVLGLRDEWRTCDQQEVRRNAGEVWGPIDALCGVTTMDPGSARSVRSAASSVARHLRLQPLQLHLSSHQL